MAIPLVQPPVQDRAGYPSEYASRVFDAPRTLALWHLASLDAPTVAVVWSLAFAWPGHVHLARWVPLVLALTTWCAYVSDRLLDARTGLQSSMQRELRERHYFHWRHRRLFVLLAVAAACIAGVVAMTFLPFSIRERGSVLAAAALAYFSGIHAAPRLPRWPRSLRRLVSKEFLVALLFTAGCILPAWSRLYATGTLEFSRWWFWIPAVYFAALAWLNCKCIARWESDDEARRAGFDQARWRVFAPCMGQSTNLFAAFLLAFAGLLLAFAAAASHPPSAALLVAGAVSALLLALLDHMRTRMTPLALRAAADLVLLTPILLFLR